MPAPTRPPLAPACAPLTPARIPLLLACGLLLSGMPSHARAQTPDTAGARVAPSGATIVPMLAQPMLNSLEGVEPSITPYAVGAGVDPATLPLARPRELLRVAEGDTVVLTAGLVRRRLVRGELVMFAFNEQYPGPLIQVDQRTTIFVRFENRLDLPSTIHWHGVRLDNRFDGVPDVTQPPVQPGETFVYEIRFPDPGIYWYHPHVLEYLQQDLGLYGNLLVRSERPDYDNPVHREEFLILDDLLVDGDSLIAYGRDVANFVIMGRFGNVLLVNGEDRYELDARIGEVVRFYLTNVSNSRIFNLSFGGAPTKLIAADLGRFEREQRVESVVIAPAQRYVVEVRFERPGELAIENRIQGLNHMQARFFAAVDTLGVVRVSGDAATREHAAAFENLREPDWVRAELEPYRAELDRPIDLELEMDVAIRDLPIPLRQFMSIDTVFRSPIEWTDAMPNMNWISTSNEVRWILRDTETGAENMEIDRTYRVGDIVRVRLRNDAQSLHPMNHPIHIHGQRFLVISKDGVPNRNLVWKDTALVPVGSVVDLLLEISNPGVWMAHCHIAEHLDAGMHMLLNVDP